MSQDDVLFGYRLQLFDLAGRIGVSAACRTFGVKRTTLIETLRRIGTPELTATSLNWTPMTVVKTIWLSRLPTTPSSWLRTKQIGSGLPFCWRFSDLGGGFLGLNLRLSAAGSMNSRNY